MALWMKPRVCCQCGGSLEWRRLDDERSPQPVCIRCGTVLWQNPKPTVSALVTRKTSDGATEVLLTRRGVPPCEGCWDVPGGFIDVDEHPEDALRREMREELGVQAEVLGFIGIFMDRYGEDDGDSTLNIYYEASIVAGTITTASDVIDADWFPLDRPPEPMAFDNGRRGLEVLRSMVQKRA
jgi:8-oxo-dGTP diphosphatase